MNIVLRTSVMATVALLALSACQPPSDAAFANRGGAESLLDVSSEVVNLRVYDKKDIAALSDLVAKDRPSSAELFCDASSKDCADAKRVLETGAVAVAVTPSPNNSVSLVYERIVARDCNARYYDAGFSAYNVSQPSFGCAIAANTVQHVTDKRDFINPSLLDTPSAIQGVSAARRAEHPKSQSQQAYGVTTSAVSSSGSGR